MDLERQDAGIAKLKARLHAQDRLIGQQADALAHQRATYERAFAFAKIGVWECDIATEALSWTDQVYELFDVPPGCPPDRRRTLQCYAPDSLKALQQLRSQAIAECSGFNLDAEITTEKGRRRWIRLTATVDQRDGVPVRIFGMKQDITEEKILFDRIRYLAEFDGLTGVANRASFQARLSDVCARQDAQDARALVLIDLDNFKQINDTFGHASGDDCLREVAARLKAVCPAPDFIARIGGDEFAVLLGARQGQDEIGQVATQIVDALGRPMSARGCSFKVGASVGVECVDACAPAELFTNADNALYLAKSAGRNTFRMYDPFAVPLRRVGQAGRL